MIPTHQQLTDFATTAHALAREKGWYDSPRTWIELVSLTQGEFHEAIAELRRAKPPDSPEFLAELADVVIRAMDAITWHGYAPTMAPPMAPPMTPPDVARARIETAKTLCERLSLSMSADMRARELSQIAWSCLEWAHANGFPLWEAVLAKHEVNKARPRKHGKVF